MDGGTSDSHPLQPVRVDTEEEEKKFANWKSSRNEIHNVILAANTFLIGGIFGFKSLSEISPKMNLLVFYMLLYFGAWGVMLRITRDRKSEFGELVYKFSLLLGTLAIVVELCILQLSILVLVTLISWILFYIHAVTKLCEYSERQCLNRVARLHPARPAPSTLRTIGVFTGFLAMVLDSLMIFYPMGCGEQPFSGIGLVGSLILELFALKRGGMMDGVGGAADTSIRNDEGDIVLLIQNINIGDESHASAGDPSELDQNHNSLEEHEISMAEDLGGTEMEADTRKLKRKRYF